MPRFAPLALLASALPLAACVSVPPPAPVAPRPRFDAIAFFTGATIGAGSLRIALHHRATTLVHGSGHLDPDGILVLVQRVDQSGKAPRTRTWRIREIAPGRYAGTLTDASGPVSGESEGDRLHLRFRMKGGLDAQQWLTLAPDGQSAHNIMVVRKLGLPVAVLDEDIRRSG